MIRLISNSEETTERIGGLLARHCKKGMFIDLDGDMGAGKTAFARGFVKALGSDEGASPTFTIVKEYKTTPPVYHFDVYRLGSAEELYDIGCEEYLDGRGIVLMEWSKLVSEILPADRTVVKIEIIGPEQRRISVLNCPEEEKFSEETHEYTCC